MNPAYSLPRNMSQHEIKTLQMLDCFDTLVDRNRLFGEFTMNEETYRCAVAVGIANPYRVERDRSTRMYFVRFFLPELHRYIWYLCRHVGFELEVDGSVRTRDGHRIDRSEITLSSTKGHTHEN